MRHGYIKLNRLLLTALFVALVLLASSNVPSAAAQVETIPVARVLNADGTLNTGASGSLDLRGWNVRLDSARGPVLTPANNEPNAPLAVSGGTWSALASGMNDNVDAIAISGSGDVYAGGNFTTAGSCTVGCNYIAKYSGGTWSPVGAGVTESVGNGFVDAIAISGSDVYAGGYFDTAGACLCNSIAKFSGGTWSALGSGVNDSVFAIAINGSGDVYAGGNFITAGPCTSGCNYVAKFSAGTWSSLGKGMSDGVLTLAVSGSNVYAGGYFTQVCGNAACNTGNTTVNRIAKFDGTTWSALGSGVNGFVNAIAVGGSTVYAGGAFTQVCGNAACNGGNTTVNFIAKFVHNIMLGDFWLSMGTGVNGSVETIAISGSDVYAGGAFTQVCGNAACNSGNTTVDYIAKFSGGTWSALGTGVNDDVRAIAISGSDVYAGGSFVTAGTCNFNCNKIAEFLFLGYHLFLPLVVR